MKTPSPTPTSKRLTDLEARQADLEKRIADLESAAARQVPWVWPTPGTPVPTPPWVDALEARCPVCLMKYSDMTHYVCGHPNCPSKVTFICGDTTCRHVWDQTQAPVFTSNVIAPGDGWGASSVSAPPHGDGVKIPPGMDRV